MSTLDDRDWELINGYADGALTAAERRAIAGRLTTEPALAAALSEVQTLKAGLSLLAPRPAMPDPAQDAGSTPRRRAGTGRPVAVAAALAVVVLGLGALLGPRFAGLQPEADIPARAAAEPSTLAQVHADFSARAYAIGSMGPVGTISTGSMGDLVAFDLAASRLTLVDVRDMRLAGRDLVAMHYRGPNGCRLTIAAMAATGQPDPGTPVGALAAGWTAGRIAFHIIATGMDGARFAAIADYVRAESLRPAEADGLRVALESATAGARPCA